MYTEKRTGYSFSNKTGQLYYVGAYGLIVREDLEWSIDKNMPDSLFRTSQAYIAYGSTALYYAMTKNCISHDYKHLIRHPEHKQDDTSRDAVILFLSALKFNGDINLLNVLIDNLSYKLSERYTMTVAMWLWMKGLRGKKHSWIYNLSYQLLELITLVPSLLLTWITRRLAGMHYEFNQNSVPQLFLQEEVKNNKWFKLYKALQYPGYATNLGSMMIYSAKKIPILTWLINRLFRCEAESTNYFIRLLNGDKKAIKDYIDSDYQSMLGLRWGGRLNGESTQYIVDNKRHYNELDIDLMETLISNYLN